MPVVFGVATFVAGFSLAGLLLRRGSGFKPKSDAAAEHQVRASEAELRVARKRAEEAAEEITTARAEIDELREANDAAKQRYDQLQAEIDRLEQGLRDECAKTQELRQELTSRAEETIRAKVQMKEMQTELSVVQAGSEAVHDEIAQLAAERERLTKRLEMLQEKLEPESAAADDALHAESYALDC
jgi:chromosome segregation ATPase